MLTFSMKEDCLVPSDTHQYEIIRMTLMTNSICRGPVANWYDAQLTEYALLSMSYSLPDQEITYTPIDGLMADCTVLTAMQGLRHSGSTTYHASSLPHVLVVSKIPDRMM